MATLNVYIPDDLRAEMNSVEDVNWSSVAQQAFRAAIQLEKLRMTTTDVEVGLERLRQSRGANEDELIALGERLGKEWALKQATYDELERVAQVHEAAEFIEGSLVNVICAIENEERVDHSTSTELVEHFFGTGYSESALDHLAAGFAQGASEIFDQV